jgi:hypothetical protein
MMASTGSGIIRDDETYTIRSLCEVLNRRETFIREHFVGKGCPYAQVGDLILFSGRSIHHWLEHFQGSVVERPEIPTLRKQTMISQ